MSTANTTNRAYGAITLGTLLPWIIGAIILLVLPILMGSKGQLTIMSQMSIMVVFALAYNMLLGQGGMLSFGHAVYMGMGSFLCLHVMNASYFGSVPLPILPLIGGFFGLGIAMIIGSFSTRSAGTIFAMISLGLGELMAACVLIIVVFFGGEEGISGYRDEGLPFFGLEFISH
ncbi:MAG: branched-chain amino acid ABC transporter permease, partial [Amylibacter sp.]|nr:branched-chain amino acid ABC transporter permease [Amylibacter sp.]